MHPNKFQRKNEENIGEAQTNSTNDPNLNTVNELGFREEVVEMQS